MNNKRFYNFVVVIYEDDDNFTKQRFNLLQEKEIIFIRHDKDVYENDVLDDNKEVIHAAGDLKKPHYHYVLKLRNACTISALAKRLEIAENMIEPVKKSLNGCLKYLIHFGCDDKYLYSVEDVESNSDKFLRRFRDLVSEEISEVDKVVSIQDYIESINDYIDLAVLGRYVQKINMWDAFRRNMMYFCKLIDQHNSRISAMRYSQDNPYFDSDYT